MKTEFKRVPTHNEIIDIVCNVHNLPKEKFFSVSRKHEIVRVRQMAATLIREFTILSLNDIGIALRPVCPFDHTTVINCIAKCKSDCENYDDFRSRYEIAKFEILSINVESYCINWWNGLTDLEKSEVLSRYDNFVNNVGDLSIYDIEKIYRIEVEFPQVLLEVEHFNGVTADVDGPHALKHIKQALKILFQNNL